MTENCRFRRVHPAAIATFALLLLAGTMRVAVAQVSQDISGAWYGSVTLARSAQGGSATCMLAQARAHVSGSLTVDAAGDGLSGTFPVRGRARGRKLRLAGALGQQHLRWRGKWDATQSVWRGKVVVKGGGAPVRGMLSLSRDGGATAPTCGNDYFASDVMPLVLEPICAFCHVAGGAAAATTFRVTAGDPHATVLTAAREVDAANPMQSKLLLKPKADLPHGGGQRVTAGSPEEQALIQWLTLVTAPGCSLGTGPGGPGGGGTGADLYASNCASCHGADARGLQGRPDIHCNRSIHDVVVAGRVAVPESMPAFTNLSDPDIGKIQDFLTGLCPLSGVTGADLYASNCASCHGPTAGGTATAPAVRCALRVADAVGTGRGSVMPSFPFVDAEVTLLEGYLDQLCTANGRTGTDVYAGNCQTCHGADGRGGTNALGVDGPDVHCARDVAGTVLEGDLPKMPAFPMSNADLTSLQSYIDGFCPAGVATGAALYTGNCQLCHGADARGVNGKPDIRCNRGIHDYVVAGSTGGASGDMPAMPGMSSADITLVQGYLTGLCPVGSVTGPELWASNCAVCHGTDGSGAGTAPDVRCATRVPDALQKGRGTRMPTFSAFAGADLTNLTGHLSQLCVQGGRTGAEMWAGNCGTCHGNDAGGGRNGLGVKGPDIACSSLGDYQEKSANGDGKMPKFPLLSSADVGVIYTWVQGAFCP